jgi:hypothetical protein
MLAANNDDVRIGEEKLFPHVVRPRRAPQDPEEEVEITGAQRIEQRLVRTIQDMDRRARIQCKKLIDRFRQQMRAGMGYVAHRYSRRENSLRGANLLDAVFELPESDLQPARELARLRGGRQAACHSLVEASAHHALDVARGSMQCRLGYLEPARCRLERPAVRDRGERPDVRIGDLVLHRFRGLATRKRCADDRVAQRCLNMREQPPNPWQQNGSERRQICSAPSTLQQLHHEGGLDLGNHLRHRRLRQAELPGGGADAVAARDRLERAQLTQGRKIESIAHASSGRGSELQE